MITYQKNNIIFRIASSDAISKFKSIQAHSFMQLARTDIGFDISAKEVVLLEFDRISQWIYRIERILLSVDDGVISDQIKTTLKLSLAEEISVIENVMTCNPNVFTESVCDFAKLVHTYSHPTLTEHIDKCMVMSIEHCFEKICELMSEYLQHLLLSMHEYNNNLITQKDFCFLTISDWCYRLTNPARKFSPLAMRGEFFRRALNCGGQFLLKNYTREENIFDAAFKFTSAHGLTLIRENTVVQN